MIFFPSQSTAHLIKLSFASFHGGLQPKVTHNFLIVKSNGLLSAFLILIFRVSKTIGHFLWLETTISLEFHGTLLFRFRMVPSLYLSLCHFCLGWCLTLLDTIWTCSLPGASSHGILQARTWEWALMPFSRELFPTWGLNSTSLH